MVKKMSTIIYNKFFEYKIGKVVTDINQIFYNANTLITHHLDNIGTKTRLNKVSFIDALLYKFKCVFENTNNKCIASEINFTKPNIEKVAHVSNYYRKEQKIPISYYNDILDKVKILSEKYSSN